MPTVKDDAICLRLIDWSETSQIVVLLTEEHGKISAVAKGAKRQSPSTLAKFSGGIELLTGGEAVLIIKPQNELAQLIEWNLLRPHWHLRRDLAAYRLAMYAVDLVHHIVQDHDPHPATTAALRALIDELQDVAEHEAALLRFQWSIVRDMGLKPELDRDAETQEPLPAGAETFGFSAIAGGVVADTGVGDRWRVRAGTIELLRTLEAGQSLVREDTASIQRANRLLCTYFRAILDRELPTMGAILR